MGLSDDDPVAAARWTRDRFEDEVLVCSDDFRLERPAGWTITGTAGERYQLRPPMGGPAVDVDIALAPRHRVPPELDVAGYLRLYLSLIAEPVEDLVMTADAFGRRCDGRWTVGPEATSALVLRTRSSFVLATAIASAADIDAMEAGERVIAAVHPLS